MRGAVRALIMLVTIVILLAAALLVWLTVAEYRPDDIETVEVTDGIKQDTLEVGTTYQIVTLNIGYAGLGRERDFFMEGGSDIMPESSDEVEENLAGITSALYNLQADIVMLQEVDTNSRRSYYIDQADYLTRGLSMGSAFAYNFKVAFIPYPIPPLGKVESGLLTLSNLQVESAERISLPQTHSWPVSTAHTKRALLVEYLPVEGTDQYLVLINLHLEAYADEESRDAQLEVLFDLMLEEYDAGNYVIAGGDFNMNFPGAEDLYPLTDEAVWVPGDLLYGELPTGLSYVYDLTVPTCRAVDKAYEGDRDDHFMYVIDGYIISDNVKMNGVQTVDLNFENTDHQPVLMDFTLQ